METIWAALIAAASSFGGYLLGFLSTRSAVRAEAERKEIEDRTEAVEKVADELTDALKTLRRVPEMYYNEMARDVYLPEHWYERFEPALMRSVGRIRDADAREALRLIVDWIDDLRVHPGASSTYHYVEGQLMVALQIVESVRRGAPIPTEAGAEVEALRSRVAALPVAPSGQE